MSKSKVTVCTGKSCRKRGSKDVLEALEETIDSLRLDKNICLKKTDCLSQCGRGPTIRVKQSDDKHFYGWVSVKDVKEVIWALVSGRPIKRLILKKKAG